MHSVMATKISTLLLLFGLFSICNAALVDEYDHFAALDPDEKVKLYWTIDEETVSFALDGATKGWVGFGISTGQGKMDKADMVIGWVKDGKPYLSDRHGVGHYPALDDHNDYKLISGMEDNGRTIIKFSRKIDTCDKQDQILKGGTTKLIFALNDEDPESPKLIKKHTFKGIRTILFLNYQGHTKKPDASWKHFDIVNRNYSVPAYHTTYHCSVHRIPDFKEKNHIIRYDAVIQPDNEGIVHHMIITVCDPNFPEHYNDYSEDCKKRANMPAEVLGCRREGLMAGGWAVGGGPFIYPSHVGFAVGSEFAGRHFILEIHYDNPGQKSDFYDSSGMRFYYTNKLREYDAGLLSGGVVTSKWMMIPPKQQAWKTVGYCSKQCTEEALKNSPLPEGGIKIFSSNLHTHLAGRAAWTQHIRNGVELPEIDRDDNYDFNFQDARTLEREIHFKPGDEIIQTCIYNTMDRENMTYGGAATTDEMCLNYLTYYPFLPNMSRLCRSIDLQAGSAMLKKYYPELKSPTKAMRNPIMASNKIWTKEMIDDYKKMLDGQTGYSATSHGCKNRNSYNLNLTLEEAVKDKYQIPIPKITTPLPKPTDNCKDVNSSAITLSVWFLSHVVCLVAVTILT